MKTRILKTAITVLILVQAHLAQPQGFFNLNFEQPILPLTPVNFQVPTANALPGWSAYTYENTLSEVVYNTLSLGSAAVSLQGANGSVPPIQGNYSVVLQGSSGSTPSSASIGQTGQIPGDSLSLIFWGGVSQVSFNGQIIPVAAIGSGANYTIYGGDISA